MCAQDGRAVGTPWREGAQSARCGWARSALGQCVRVGLAACRSAALFPPCPTHPPTLIHAVHQWTKPTLDSSRCSRSSTAVACGCVPTAGCVTQLISCKVPETTRRLCNFSENDNGPCDKGLAKPVSLDASGGLPRDTTSHQTPARNSAQAPWVEIYGRVVLRRDLSFLRLLPCAAGTAWPLYGAQQSVSEVSVSVRGVLLFFKE
jgi:hypothetical protein